MMELATVWNDGYAMSVPREVMTELGLRDHQRIDGSMMRQIALRCYAICAAHVAIDKARGDTK
jgi:hypothetical protein